MAGGMDWFRWHHGSVTDPKFQLVARKAEASLPDVLAVWVYVLEAASQSSDRGAFGTLDCEALDLLFGFSDGRTTKILDAMSVRGLLVAGRVAAWAKRQPKRERDGDLSTERVQAFRHRKRQETPQNTTPSQETPRGEEKRRDEKTPPSPPHAGEVGGDESETSTKAGAVCKAIKAKGVSDVNPSNPKLRALIEKGVGVEIFEQAAEMCMKVTPPKGMAYLLGIVERQWREAVDIGASPGMPARAWDESRSSIEAKAAELGIEKWNDADLSASREQWPTYVERIRAAIIEREESHA